MNTFNMVNITSYRKLIPLSIERIRKKALFQKKFLS